MISFMENCFRGQEYRLTTLGTPEHDMWDFVDDDQEGNDVDTDHGSVSFN